MGERVEERRRTRAARGLLVASSALVFVASGAVAQQPAPAPGQEQIGAPQIASPCVAELRTFQQELDTAGFGAWDPAWGRPSPPEDEPPGVAEAGVPDAWGPMRLEMRDLLQAAHLMAARGNEEGCQAILQEMRELYGEWMQMAQEPADPVGWRRGHLAAAQPVAEAPGVVRTRDVMGADVRNLQDERLGTIEDVVLDPRDRSIRYVLVARGGFLGIGDELIPVRWQDLQVTPDRQTFVFDVPEAAMDGAPSADDPEFFFAADDDWWAQVEQYWDQQTAG